jgi:hypothetical protein
MGVTHFTYCGPYVECKVGKTTSTFPKSRCSNPACKQHTRESEDQPDQFCGQCGSPFETVAVEREVETVDPYELQEKFGGVLWQPFGRFKDDLSEHSLHIWVGTKEDEDKDDQGNRSLVSDDEEESLREIQVADIGSELKQFHRTYAEELNRLRTVYGRANVTVKWGLVQAIHS